MGWFQKTGDFISKHHKGVKIACWSIVSVCFVGSVAWAAFGGGEFSGDSDTSNEVKGFIKGTELVYTSSYLDGDAFSFDKDTSKIRLVAKDPEIETIVNIDDLPASEYGFMINDSDEYYQDASSITMSGLVKSVSLVSRVYRNLKTELPVSVYKLSPSATFASSLLMEAETADLYAADGTLLSEEDKATLPNTSKPYRSDKGEITDGAECSGGAAIRNFSSGMKFEFQFVSSKAIDLALSIKACLRPASVNFDDGYSITVNGQSLLTEAVIPGGTGYYTPYTLPDVTISAQKGMNTIVMSYNKSNPCNLDALSLTSSEDVLSDKSALILENEDEPATSIDSSDSVMEDSSL